MKYFFMLVVFCLISYLVFFSPTNKFKQLGNNANSSQFSLRTEPQFINISKNVESSVGSESSSSRMAEANRLFNLYNEKYTNSGSEGRNILDSIDAFGLEKNAKNVKSIRILLKSKIRNEEKVALINILSGQYSHDDVTGLNNEILSELRSMIYSGQGELGKAAILSYSRLGYFGDSEQILAFAKKSDFIDSNEYYGDLAHLLPYAPVSAQHSIMNTIKSGGNGFSAEILSSIINNKEDLKNISVENLNMMKTFLNENEPQFPQATGRFGLIDAVRYADWLQSISNLNSIIDNKDKNHIVIDYLNNEKIDPRKIMAFLLSSGDELIADSTQLESVKKLQSRIISYSKQYPQNKTMEEVVAEISNKIKGAH